MFCSKCGTEIPDEANFCWKCGKPQKEGVVTDPPKYEICEIVWSHRKDGFHPFSICFWAKAIGKTGVYSAGQSSYFFGFDTPRSDETDAYNAHKQLIEKLTKDGWEPLQIIGSMWYSTKFRRLFKN